MLSGKGKYFVAYNALLLRVVVLYSTCISVLYQESTGSRELIAKFQDVD